MAELIGDLREIAAKLDKGIASQPHGDVLKHAKHQRDVLLPAMAELRVVADKLELTVADEYWPLPKYREMLFVR